MTTIYTIGYQGKEIGPFLEALKSRGVRLLVDVRELPASRKKYFSKRSLRDILQRDGIQYLHYPGLGSSSELRAKFMSDGDFAYFREHYTADYPSRKSAVEQIAEFIPDTPLCLMCYEADPLVCHRSIVADEVVAICGDSTRVEHI